jgi:hypothetical protein
LEDLKKMGFKNASCNEKDVGRISENPMKARLLIPNAGATNEKHDSKGDSKSAR